MADRRPPSQPSVFSTEEDRREQGVGASSQEFAAYDQVAKPHEYRLSEQPDEQYDDDNVVRVCDMKAWWSGDQDAREGFAQELGESLEDIGFAVLAGHGIASEVFDRAEQAARCLFEQNELSTKLGFRARRHGSVNQGYFPREETSRIHPDQVEGWVFCRRAFQMEPDPCTDLSRFWPDVSLEPALRELCEANQSLIRPIMRSILRYLGCDTDRYDAALVNPNIGLRLNYYPPVSAAMAERGVGRLLGHEDVGMFTLLPAPDMEGLQVLHRESGKWVRLQAPPGSIILNTGDYVQRITNDRLPSTTHRVALPRDQAAQSRVRITTPMNVYVWEEHLLEVLPELPDPRYPPVTALEFHTASTARFYGDDYAVDS